MGKNLIGAFWQPSAVISSQAVLGTLPERERRCGLAEALKHGLLGDEQLVSWCLTHADQLRALDPVLIRELVARCCRIKAEIVRDDERDAGRRAALNLGHTYGHAYETLLGYGTLTHGEAVALGMVWAARLSEALGVAKRGLEAAVIQSLRAFDLPFDTEADGLPSLSELTCAAQKDKKSDQSHVTFILLEEIGRTLIRTLPWIQIEEALLGGPSRRPS
jgi:3-dehydroquinate synthase